MTEINIEQMLKEMPTRKLLQYLNSARGCGGSFDPTDCGCYYITVKQLKDELATREHIPNKKESKLIRRHNAKRKV